MIPAATGSAEGADRSNLSEEGHAEEGSWFCSALHHPKAPWLGGIKVSPM